MDTLWIIPFMASPSVSLDGKLDEEVYQHAMVIDRFHAIYPDTLKTYPVRIYMFHDGRNLYIGGEFINPYGIHAQTTERDRVNDVMDDQFYLNISHRDVGYVFGLYPLGTQVDQLITNYNRWSRRWDFDWKSASTFSDTVWTFEMVIPVYRLELGDTVGIRLDVAHMLPQEMGWFQISSTMRFPLEEMGDVRYSTKAVFEGGITYEKSRPQIVFSPYVVAVYTNPYQDIGYFRISSTPFHYRMGGDLEIKTNRWGIYSTLLPDYSQVEADIAQFNLERASMLYLPEKRPFFQEKLELVEKDILDLFYTRSIEDITFGIKGFYESESRKAQGFYVKEGDRNFAGIAYGYQRGRTLIAPFVLLYGDSLTSKNLGSIFARYYHRGLIFSLQGAYASNGARAFGLSSSYSKMGTGGFYMSINGFTDNFDFPTVYLPFGPGLLHYRAGFWINRNRKSPYMYFINANLGYSSRKYLKDGAFFSEEINSSLSAGIVKNLLVNVYANRYTSILVSYYLTGGAIGIGPDFSRIILAGGGFGTYNGAPMNSYGISGSYMLGRVRAYASVDVYEIGEGESLDRMLITYVGVSARFGSGFYVNAFYQRNRSLTTGYFPAQELQVILGYEWGGRSRLYLVIHPYRQGETVFNNEFFKASYTLYF